MPSMEGVVTIVQEGRFQLVGSDGVARLFLLSHGAAAEPAQLAPLQNRQARVRVRYRVPRNIIGLIAKSVDVLN